MRPTSHRFLPRAAAGGRIRTALLIGAGVAASWLPCPAAAAPPVSGDVVLAYVDPGTGSFVIQALVAVIAGVAVSVRLYWGRIKAFFTGRSSEIDVDDEE